MRFRRQREITVMTNGLNIASELAEAEGVNVILSGGLLRKQSLSLQGSTAALSLIPMPDCAEWGLRSSLPGRDGILLPCNPGRLHLEKVIHQHKIGAIAGRDFAVVIAKTQPLRRIR